SEPQAAREAWDAAGEAWRRDDQPQAASRALGRALELAHGDPVGTALARVKLAGVLSELGRIGDAVALCREAAECEIPSLRAIALDGLIAGLLEMGREQELRERVEQLLDQAVGAMASAGWFRLGQVHALGGHLGDAEARFASVIAI